MNHQGSHAEHLQNATIEANSPHYVDSPNQELGVLAECIPCP